MWRILVALALMCGVADAQPVLTPWRPPAGCSTNDVIKFNGTSWVCGAVSGGITNSAGSNVLMKSDGTNAVASSWTDDGTTSTTTGNVSIANRIGFGIDENGIASVDTVINNLDPGGKTIVHIMASDDTSTLLTGIDATGYSSGDVIYLLNTGRGLGDAQSLLLQYEHTSSSAANRIVTPDRRPYKVGGSSGVALIRAPTLDDSGNPTADIRWHVLATTDHERVSVQDLQFYPPLNVGVTTPISGTFNDWDPTGDQYQSYTTSGLDGSDLVFKNHTLIRVGVDAAGATITGMYQSGSVSFTDLDKHTLKIIGNFGPGNLTLKHLNPSSSGANQMVLPCSGDLVLREGESAVFYHNVTWKLVSGPTSRLCPHRMTIASIDAAQAAVGITMVTGQNQGIEITNSATGQTATGGVSNGIKVTMSGSYNATALAASPTGIASICTATRSAGANAVDCFAIQASATGCSGGTCRAFYANGGEVRLSSSSAFIAGSTSDLVGNVTTYANNVFGDANADLTSIWGHMRARGTAPAASSCGSSPSVQGTDLAGYFTTGSGATGCTVTFSRTQTNKPSCVIWAENTATPPTCTISATAITCGTAAASTAYHYHCIELQ